MIHVIIGLGVYFAPEPMGGITLARPTIWNGVSQEHRRGEAHTTARRLGGKEIFHLVKDFSFVVLLLPEIIMLSELGMRRKSQNTILTNQVKHPFSLTQRGYEHLPFDFKMLIERELLTTRDMTAFEEIVVKAERFASGVSETRPASSPCNSISRTLA